MKIPDKSTHEEVIKMVTDHLQQVVDLLDKIGYDSLIVAAANKGDVSFHTRAKKLSENGNIDEMVSSCISQLEYSKYRGFSGDYLPDQR